MKPWYLSKTILVNFIAFVALALQAKYGTEVLSAETQGMIVAGVNVGLRVISQSKITLW